MARIPEYTQQVFLDRANASNISAAGRANGGIAAQEAMYEADRYQRSVQQIGQFGEQLARQKQAEAELNTRQRFNEYKRMQTGLYQEQQNQRMTKPDGFANDFDGWIAQNQEEFELQMAEEGNDQPFDMDMYRRMVDEDRTSVFQRSTDWENGMRVQNVTVGTENTLDQMNVNFSLSNPRIGDLPKQLQKTKEYVNTTGALVLNPEQNQRLFTYGANGATVAVMDSMLETDPRTLKDVMYYGSATKDQLIDMTMFDIEGGDKIAAEPGGGIAKFGISSDIPGEKRSGLTAEQVKALTPETAREWYAKKWDPRLDKMDPAFRAIAHDAIVNHGNDKDTWSMIDKAKGDPYMLIALRQQKYAGLIAANPEKYAQYSNGWNRRMSDLTRYTKSLESGGNEFLQHASLLDPDIINRTRSQIPGAIDAQNRQIEADRKIKVDAFAASYKNAYSTITENLEPLSAETINTLKQQAVNTEDPALVAKADALGNMRVYVNSLKGYSVDQLRTVVRKASATVNKEPTEENRLALELTEGVLSKQIEAIKTEGLAYFGRTSQIKMPQPINYADAVSANNELLSREASSLTVFQKTGDLMPVLLPDEIDELKENFETLPANEVAGMLSAYDQLDQTTKSNLAQAVDAKSPILATAIAVNDLATRRRLVQGAKIEPKYDKPSMEATISGILDPMVVDPEFIAGAQKAVMAHYNALSNEARDFSPGISEDRVTASISALYGPVVDINTIGTNNIFSFKDPATNDWVPEDDLYDMFNDLDDTQLTKLFGELPKGALGETITAEDIKSAGRIVSAGDGLYNVAFDETGGLMDKNGRLLEIDGRALLALWRKGRK